MSLPKRSHGYRNYIIKIGRHVSLSTSVEVRLSKVDALVVIREAGER